MSRGESAAGSRQPGAPGQAAHGIAPAATVVVYAALGPFLLGEFEISHVRLGLPIAISAVGGAVVGLVIRPANFHPRLAAVGAAVSLLMLATAPGYGFVVLAAISGAVALGAIMADSTAGRRRGDGFFAAIVLGGVLLPQPGDWWGWRWAVVLYAAVCLGPALPARRPQPVNPEGAGGPDATGAVLFALLVGCCVGSLLFVPLFVVEELARSAQLGGAALAVAGGVAIAGGGSWIRDLRRPHLGPTLVAGLGFLGAVAMTLSDIALPALWLGAGALGGAAGWWRALDPPTWARSGFLIGLGAVAPLYGRAYDLGESYLMMWILSAAAALLALGVALLGAAREAPGLKSSRAPRGSPNSGRNRYHRRRGLRSS